MRLPDHRLFLIRFFIFNSTGLGLDGHHPLDREWREARLVVGCHHINQPIDDTVEGRDAVSVVLAEPETCDLHDRHQDVSCDCSHDLNSLSVDAWIMPHHSTAIKCFLYAIFGNLRMAETLTS